MEPQTQTAPNLFRPSLNINFEEVISRIVKDVERTFRVDQFNIELPI